MNILYTSVDNYISKSTEGTTLEPRFDSVVYQEQEDHPRLTIMVDGSCKNNKGVIAGIILDNNNLVICWSTFFSACPTSDYAEVNILHRIEEC